jgi:DNA-binding FadR family transcriptional regulator
MLEADYPHARRETVAAAHAAIFEALKTRDPMLAELATLHHIKM